MAILAGDALLTEAFCLLALRQRAPGIPPESVLAVLQEIADAAGLRGMVGGQALDILAQNEKIGMEGLHEIHRLKTGALLRVSLRAGAILAGAGKEALEALSDYGEKIGLAFQIADDILNVEGDPALLGKGTGSDAARGKTTFPALLGVDASRARAEELVIGAVASLAPFDDRAAPLRKIARYILARRS